MLALVQAAGLVNADRALQARGLGKLLQFRQKLTLAVRSTRRARRALGTNILTDKNMAFKRGQNGKSSTSIVTGWPQPRSKTKAASISALAGCTGPGPICDNGERPMETDNLVALKDDMVAFIEGHGLRRLPGYVTEDIPAILWEGEDNPDSWKDFVEMAKHAGALFVTISEVKLDREELDELVEEAGELNFPDEESSELVEAQWLQKYAGKVGYIQLGFVHQGIMFLHETTTEWYERYQELLEGIESFGDILLDDPDGESEDL